mmetsp:Transcript_46698/g.117543  ORF Transcript_46698/g.117543 Transcript_46698/m.117543 type:complete len:200 (+) Transcript_46698:192-791(+)
MMVFGGSANLRVLLMPSGLMSLYMAYVSSPSKFVHHLAVGPNISKSFSSRAIFRVEVPKLETTTAICFSFAPYATIVQASPVSSISIPGRMWRVKCANVQYFFVRISSAKSKLGSVFQRFHFNKPQQGSTTCQSTQPTTPIWCTCRWMPLAKLSPVACLSSSSALSHSDIQREGGWDDVCTASASPWSAESCNLPWPYA